VVQVIVSEVLDTLVAVTAEITGVAAGEAVVNVALGDVLDVFAEFADTTSKSYVVPAVKPVSVTEWLVVSVVLSVDELPYPVVLP
jgi:hypothetical protein